MYTKSAPLRQRKRAHTQSAPSTPEQHAQGRGLRDARTPTGRADAYKKRQASTLAAACGQQQRRRACGLTWRGGKSERGAWCTPAEPNGAPERGGGRDESLGKKKGNQAWLLILAAVWMGGEHRHGQGALGGGPRPCAHYSARQAEGWGAPRPTPRHHTHTHTHMGLTRLPVVGEQCIPCGPADISAPQRKRHAPPSRRAGGGSVGCHRRPVAPTGRGGPAGGAHASGRRCRSSPQPTSRSAAPERNLSSPRTKRRRRLRAPRERAIGTARADHT